jgi:hypothetical protein
LAEVGLRHADHLHGARAVLDRLTSIPARSVLPVKSSAMQPREDLEVVLSGFGGNALGVGSSAGRSGLVRVKLYLESRLRLNPGEQPAIYEFELCLHESQFERV